MSTKILQETTAPVAFAAAAEVLLADPAQVVCDDVEARRTTLHADVAGFDVAREVAVSFGTPRWLDEHTVTVPVAWHAVTARRGFPVAEGSLELTALSEHPPRTRLAFVGEETPPLGPVGSIGDAVAGRRVAERTVRAVLAVAAERLTGLVRGGVASRAAAASAAHLARPAVVLPRD